MKFTERELYLLSDGILRLVGQVNDAAIALSPSSPADLKTALEEYRKELRDLNGKICDMMEDAEQPKQKTVVKILCARGSVVGVYRNSDGADIEAYVLDLDDANGVDPTLAEEVEEAETELRRDIESGAVVPIW